MESSKESVQFVAYGQNLLACTVQAKTVIDGKLYYVVEVHDQEKAKNLGSAKGELIKKNEFPPDVETSLSVSDDKQFDSFFHIHVVPSSSVSSLLEASTASSYFKLKPEKSSSESKPESMDMSYVIISSEGEEYTKKEEEETSIWKVSRPDPKSGKLLLVKSTKANKTPSSSLSSSSSSFSSELHKKVLERGDSIFKNWNIDNETFFTKLMVILNSESYQLLQSIEACSINSKVWNFEKCKITPIEAIFVQCFWIFDETPASDDMIENLFKNQWLRESPPKFFNCIATECGCGKTKSENNAMMHLQSRFVIYICCVCGAHFNTRVSATSHGSQYCDYFIDNKSKVETAMKPNGNIMTLHSEEIEAAEEAENTILSDEDDLTFENFIEILTSIGKKQGLINLDVQVGDIIKSLLTAEKYHLMSYQVMMLHAKKLVSTYVPKTFMKSMSHRFKIYYDKTHAFQLVERSSKFPIAYWDFLDMLTFYKDKNPYYCNYPGCSCTGKYYNNNVIRMKQHIQNRNFILVCVACKKSFTRQSDLELHFADCSLPESAGLGYKKQKFLESRARD